MFRLLGLFEEGLHLIDADGIFGPWAVFLRQLLSVRPVLMLPYRDAVHGGPFIVNHAAADIAYINESSHEHEHQQQVNRFQFLKPGALLREADGQ